MSYVRETQGVTYTYQSLLISLLYDIKNAKYMACMGDAGSYMEKLHSLWVFSPPEVKEAMGRRGMDWPTLEAEIDKHVAEAACTRNPFVRGRRINGAMKQKLDAWLEAMIEELIMSGYLVKQRIVARGEERG